MFFKKNNISGKHLNISITIVSTLIIIIGGFAGYLIYQEKRQSVTIPVFLNQEKNSLPPITEAKDVKPTITKDELDKVAKFLISSSIPELIDFNDSNASLNIGSAIPISAVNVDKREGYKGGTDITITAQMDKNGQKEALVQSVYLYDNPVTTQKLNLRGYTQDGFTKQDCIDVGDECSLFYRKPVNKTLGIENYKLFFRKDNIIVYLEYAGNQDHKNHDGTWLKKLGNTLVSREKKVF